MTTPSETVARLLEDLTERLYGLDVDERAAFIALAAYIRQHIDGADTSPACQRVLESLAAVLAQMDREQAAAIRAAEFGLIGADPRIEGWAPTRAADDDEPDHVDLVDGDDGEPLGP